ncbi:protein PRY1-like [Carica papaya]|uniref:protein PRY1-like n=1 Tax=Carica papaya TaxID=3649 RepID=UPI000B8CF739|nr:protein PRY1-like [Carica papaya]
MLAVLIFLLAQLYPILATPNKHPAHRRPAQRPVNPIAPNRLPNHSPVNPSNLPAPRHHRQTPIKPTSNRNRAGHRPRAKRSRGNRLGGRRRRRHWRRNRNHSPVNRTYLEAYRRRHHSKPGRPLPINRGNNHPKVEKIHSPNKNINPRRGRRRWPVNRPAPTKPVHMPNKPINPPKKQLPVKPINPPPKRQMPVKPINPPTRNVPVPVKKSPVNPPTTKTPTPKSPIKNIPVGNKQSPINPPATDNRSPINNNPPPTDNSIAQTSNKSPANENPPPSPRNNQSPSEPNNNATPKSPAKGEQAADILEFLVEHNKVRSSVGQPFYLWDKKLEDFARSWANERIQDCKMIHSDGPYGENLFWGGSNRWTAAEAVRLWADERQFYNAENNTCQEGKTCGHYTQIVWRDSYKLGCARVECRKGGVFIVCAYDPCGNYEGESPFDIHETQQSPSTSTGQR